MQPDLPAMIFDVVSSCEEFYGCEGDFRIKKKVIRCAQVVFFFLRYVVHKLLCVHQVLFTALTDDPFISCRELQFCRICMHLLQLR